MDSPNSIVIETHSLSKTYKNIEALKGLNLKVSQHSIFGFLGPNGAGKTTTIKLLLGLSRPTSGSASVFGLDILGDSVNIRKRVGYLAQDPRYYEHMSARETLRFTARFFYSGPPAILEARVQETLELVGLEEKADRPIKSFSGGERQRLGIAQAQINYPDLLILDEPAASLDPQGRRDVLDVMERLRKYTTIFYSTHILDDVQRVSDTVAILNHGELVAQAPIDELLASSGGLVYQVGIRGDGTHTQQVLAAQSWVTHITQQNKNGISLLQVSVTDEATAETELLRVLLADESVKVTEFCRQKYDLEEVFLNIVEGGRNGK
jgi:ABC-2 type transport system ATP-binding protein